MIVTVYIMIDSKLQSLKRLAHLTKNCSLVDMGQ